MLLILFLILILILLFLFFDARSQTEFGTTGAGANGGGTKEDGSGKQLVEMQVIGPQIAAIISGRDADHAGNAGGASVWWPSPVSGSRSN